MGKGTFAKDGLFSGLTSRLPRRSLFYASNSIQIHFVIEDNEMEKIAPSIVVTGFVKVDPRDREAFVKLLQAHVPRVRKKDGCIAYAFAADMLDPNVVRMSEAWRDQKSLTAHLADDEFQGVLKELGQIEIIERSVQRYDVSSVTDI